MGEKSRYLIAKIAPLSFIVVAPFHFMHEPPLILLRVSVAADNIKHLFPNQIRIECVLRLSIVRLGIRYNYLLRQRRCTNFNVSATIFIDPNYICYVLLVFCARCAAMQVHIPWSINSYINTEEVFSIFKDVECIGCILANYF